MGKHIPLASVADVAIERGEDDLGSLQSLIGVYFLRIENVGVRRSATDDVQIQGIANSIAFGKLFPTRSMKHDAIPLLWDLALLQKLEEVGSSVKRVYTLIEEQHSRTSEPADYAMQCAEQTRNHPRLHTFCKWK